MKWGNAAKPAARTAADELWSGDGMTVAAAACAAQLPVAGLLAYVLSLGRDDYGASSVPGAGFACVLLFAPLLLPVMGLVHASLTTLPALALGRLARRRIGPRAAGRPRDGRGEQTWSAGLALAGLLPVGAAWGAFFALLGGPFVALALGAAASGVVPVLAAEYTRRRGARVGRPPRARKVWLRAALASVVATAALFGLAVLATTTGLIEEYEPPQPSPRQLAGSWRYEDGGKVAFTLDEDGHARVPRARDECGGDGKWSVGTSAEFGGEPRPVVLIEIKKCEGVRSWTIGGTEDDLELFVVSGDMDAPDIEKLHQG
ncbi:hypothetical protein [Streptomyces sp. NPDC087300]|uniref:hypothetical protein n=1 Tax=Streptomyces sp. NPDC087300 TaxID=3365780 RepID=UPI00382B6D8E